MWRSSGDFTMIWMKLIYTCLFLSPPTSLSLSLHSCSYPDTLPEVYVSSNELSRKSQDDLNSDLQQFISTSLSPGEVALLNIVEWIRDNAGTFFPISASSNDALEQESDQTKEDSGPGANFCRMWLYMHHIYSKTKRRNILAHADELQLTGFCLPGKPGIVCVEGSSQNTKDFYSTLRRWNWKSIACRRKEMVESKDLDSNRRIRGFAELAFDTHGSRQTHMDMGQFLEYLKRHKLEYMFKELFGVEGHIDWHCHNNINTIFNDKNTVELLTAETG